MSINFGKFKENKDMIKEFETIKDFVEWIDNKPHQPKETKILTEVFSIRYEREYYSLYQGSYPVYFWYTPTIAVVVENKFNSGSKYYVILGGYDAVRYKESVYDTVETWLGENLINVEFKGDFATTESFESKKELNEFLEEVTWFDLVQIK